MKAEEQTLGFDVSEHNGLLDQAFWDAAFAQGYRFVNIRAGYGVPAGMQLDAQYNNNVTGARNAGFLVNHYMYAYPGRSGGDVQAHGFMNVVTLAPYELMSIDMEDDPTYGRLLVASDVSWAKLWLDTAYARYSVKGMTYMNSNVLARFDWASVVGADYGLWLANYGPNNGSEGTTPSSDEWPFFAEWQFTSRATIAGHGPIDENFFNGTLDQLRAYGEQNNPTPVPAPSPSPTPTPLPETYYTAVSGDSMSLIAEKVGETLAQLEASNPHAGHPAGNYNVIWSGDVFLVSGSPAPIPAPAGQFNLTHVTDGYVNSIDASNGKNSNSKVQPGVYRITTQAHGMINVVRLDGSGGWWINPNV